MDVREMRIFSADQIDVPQKLPEILKNFSKEVIRNNPENLLEFCREYFEEQRRLQLGGEKVFAATAAAKETEAPDFEELGKLVAKQAMEKFDTNADGVLSKAEAEPMFHEAFNSLKEAGKLSADFQWSTPIFLDGWNQIDVNVDDCL